MQKLKFYFPLFLIIFNSKVNAQFNNQLYSWGENSNGQLGLGFSNNPKSPSPTGFGNDWKLILPMQNGVIAIKSEGTLWAWGIQSNFELGLPTNYSKKPIQIGNDTNWANIYTSEQGLDVIGIKTDGTLWGWGLNSIFQLGLGHNQIVKTPVQIGTTNDWKSVFRNGSSTYAIKKDGTLWGWGLNDKSQLGTGNSNSIKIPTQIGKDNNWVFLTSNGYNTIGLKADSTIWGWGINEEGQLGTGNLIQVLIPKQIGTDNNWKSVSFTGYSVFGIKHDGTLWAWGKNSYGCLGLNNNTQLRFTSPELIYSTKKWANVYSNFYTYSIFAIKEDGTLWAWGNNSQGQLGLGDYSNKIAPTQIGTDQNWSSVQVFNGMSNISLKKDGTLWAWGSNHFGQLGIGSTKTIKTPLKIGINNDWKNVYSKNGLCNYAIKSDNSIWFWGLQSFYDTIISPEIIKNHTEWKMIKVGPKYSIGLKFNGSLWSWGMNDSGQLGLNDLIERTVPTLIGKDTNWIDVQLGSKHVLALKSNGTLWGWGGNQLGQLGLGLKFDTIISKPILIDSIAKWKSISCGNKTSFGIKKDGSLWGWGAANAYRSRAFQKNAPTQIGLDTNWIQVSAGLDYILFSGIKSNNTLWISYQENLWNWKEKFVTPVQIGNDSDWHFTSAGEFNLYALKKNKSLWLGNYNNSWTMKRIGNNLWNQIEASQKYCVCIDTNFNPFIVDELDEPNQLDSNKNWIQISSRSESMLSNKHFIGIQRSTNNLYVHNPKHKGVSFYPNPTSDYLRYTSQTGDPISIQIFDLCGNLVLTGEYSGEIQIESLKPGLYVIRTQFTNQFFIKN